MAVKDGGIDFTEVDMEKTGHYGLIGANKPTGVTGQDHYKLN